MAISYVGTGSAFESNASTTAATPSYPSGIAAGDLLLAFCAESPGYPGFVAPSGWTTVVSYAGCTRVDVFAKTATGSESGTATFATDSSGDSGYAGAVIVAYRGATTPTVFATARDNGAAASVSPSVTTSAANQWVVYAWGQYTGNLDNWFAALTSPPPTERYNSSRRSSAYSAALKVADLVQTSAGTSPAVTATVAGAAAAYTGMVALVLPVANVAPNSPTLLSPATSGYVDRTLATALAWSTSDNDPGDSQSGFDLQYRIQGTSTWTTTSGTTPTQSSTFAANTFANNTIYEWQVRTYDALGLVGPWSSSSFFTAATPPPPPTITSPASGATITTSSAVLSWTAPNQAHYRVRRLADDGSGNAVPGTVYYDSGDLVDAATRSVTVSLPVNGRAEHLQVEVGYQSLSSTLADVKVTITYTRPPAPVITALTPVETHPPWGVDSLDVAWAIPAPISGQPAVSSLDVLIDDGDADGLRRVVTGLAPIGPWRHCTPASGRDYSGNIFLVAIGANGATATSAAFTPPAPIVGGGGSSGSYPASYPATY